VSTRAPLVAELQPAGWSDLDRVMEVMGSAFDPRFGEAWSRAQCAGILPMSGVSMVLASQGGTPLGFTLARQVGDEAELLLLAVVAEARGRGIGSQLLVRFIGAAAAAGARKLHLEVRDGNPAVQLYQRHEFATKGRRHKYYRGTDGSLYDALTMIRLI
jgi:ribosomal-protein-alanine N-acetyltransferase